MTERTLRVWPDALRGVALGTSGTQRSWIQRSWIQRSWIPLFWTQLFLTQLFLTHLLWTQPASAQATAPDAGELGDCTRSREPHECAERCPSFDTCYVADDAQLYYRVMGERFECAGLDCNAASVQLGDYCCQRGEYAPPRGGGGGCTLTPASSLGRAAPGERSSLPGLCVGALAALLLGPLLVVRRRVRTGR